MPQLTEQQIREALNKGVSPQQIESFIMSGKASSTGLPSSVKKVTESRYKSNTAMGKLSDGINTIYDKFKNLPVVKQVSQAVGGVVGTLGAIEGGIIGGGGQIIKNIAKGDDIGKDVIKSAITTGKETASFGYGIGKEGVPAASLGAFGKLPNLAVAYSQGYQGVKDLYEGTKEGNVEKQITGALELGTSLVGSKNLTTGKLTLKNALIDPVVFADIKKLPSSVRANAYQSVRNNTVNAYKEIINQTPKEFKLDLKYGKNTPEFLTDQGIILKAEGGKLNNVEAISALSERADPLIMP